MERYPERSTHHGLSVGYKVSEVNIIQETDIPIELEILCVSA